MMSHRRWRRFTLGLAVTLSSSTIYAHAISKADQQGAEGFLGSLYKTYATNDPKLSWRKVLGETRVFAPATAALLAQNRRLLRGEVGTIDADVFCMCQDFDSVSYVGGTFTPGDGPNRVNVTARLRRDRMPVELRLVLEHTPLGWRVYDVGLPQGGTLRLVVAAANRQLTPTADPPAAKRSSALKPGDMIAAGEVLGFTGRNGKLIDSCDAPALDVTPVDLNGDGVPEVIVGDGLCNGGDSGWFGIATRLPSGAWRSVLQQQGGYDVLATRHNGWADLRVTYKGASSPPVFRWSGNGYARMP